jgi:predicted metal-dependent hydrolase
LELQVFPDGRIRLRVPLRTSQKEIREFVESHRGWLSERLIENDRRPKAKTLNYQHGEEHLVLGRRVPLLLENASRKSVSLSDSGLVVSGSSLTADQVQGVLENWYRSQARVWYQELIDKHMPWFQQRGHKAPKLHIKKMKSRWGSLSMKGNMSLNLELVKTPLVCIEYVVVHELCHLEQQNHGPKFKSLMDLHLPDWRERKKKLDVSPLV